MSFIPIIFIWGFHNYDHQLSDYKDIRVVCPRCHNASVIAETNRKFFTVCWVPIIPLSWGKKLQCTICPWASSISKEELERTKQQQQQQQQQGGGHYQPPQGYYGPPPPVPAHPYQAAEHKV